MENKLKTFVLRGIALGLILALSYVLFKYAVPVVLPFLISYAVSALIRPLSSFLSKKTGLSNKVWAVLLVAASVAVVSVSLWFLGSTLIREAKEALKMLGKGLSDENSAVRQASDKMMNVLKDANIVSKNTDGVVSDALMNLLSKAAGSIGSFVSGAPNAVFFVAVTVISLFYFSCDTAGIKKELSRFLPEKIMNGAKEWSAIAMRALGRFLKAYMSLLGITFVLLLAGFLLVRVKYPFLSALIVSLVDILPVLGVGSVLVPWSVILFLTGESVKGVGMLILFFVIYATRQILEPKIVGNAAGVHPILALFFVFLGFWLFGLSGMILAPIALNAVTVFLEEKKKKSFS